MARFEPGDSVGFGAGMDWVIGEVEEVRKGHEGDHLLVVRAGSLWTGPRYVVLSSYAQRVGNGIL